MKAGSRKSLGGFLALVWLAILVSAYFIRHKPFTPDLAAGLARATFQVGVVLTILSLAGALGAWTLSRANLALSTGRPVLEVALGLGALSAAFLILGAGIGVNAPIAWGSLVLLILLLRPWLGRWWLSWRPWLDLRPRGWIEALIGGGAALLVIATLAIALAPPLKFDALVYHLAIPQSYLISGRVTYLTGNIFWGMPQLTEILYTWAMALAGVQAAATLGWAAGLVSVLGLFSSVAERFQRRAGWIAVAALLSGYSLVISLAWGYVDWIAFLFGWAALEAFLSWQEERRGAFLALAGIFAGMAVGTKYTAGVLTLAGVGLIAWQHRGINRALLRDLLLFCGASALAFSPWGVKNALATGNPFYPLIFPAGMVDKIRLDFYQIHPVEGAWWQVLILPLLATISGAEGAPHFGASIGPSLLGLGALFWLGRATWPGVQQRAISTAGVMLAVGWVVWAIASRLSALLDQTRLYLVLFPALSLLAGAGYAGLAAVRLPGVRLHRVAAGLVVFVLGLNVLQVSALAVGSGSFQVLLGLREPETYLADNLGWYAPAMEAIREMPPDHLILMLWEPRGYHCAPRCEPDEVLDRWIHAVRTLGEPAEILNAWRSAGFTHLLYYRAGAEFIRQDDPRYRPEDWQALDAFLASLPPPEDFGGIYSLYRLTP